MKIKQIHFFSGVLISLFVGFHLFNHAMAWFGADRHIETMQQFRPFYRNIVVETLLLAAVFVQIYSGIRLFRAAKLTAISFFEKIQIWSGLYLAMFFVIHLSAVLGGRFVLNLDTNFYFGVAGLNTFPFNLFFIPYYGLAIVAFFGHIAAIHAKKMKRTIIGISPNFQAKIMFMIGILLSFLLIFGLTNQFQGVSIPAEYQVLIGK